MIFSDCVSHSGNILVVLPTGLGKTVIMAYLAAFFLKKFPSKQILVLTPTRPLVRQIKEMMTQFIGNLTPELVLEISGEIKPEERTELYPNAKIIVGTPQTVENDLTYSRLNLNNISLMCIDEVHRATGDYAYVGITSQMKKKIVGFTATPGNNPNKILEVCNNLKISYISFTDPSEASVADYVSLHTPKVVWIHLPEVYKDVLTILQNFQDEIISNLTKSLPSLEKSRYIGKREALAYHQQVVQLTKEDPQYGEFLIATSNLIRVQHLQELVESQGFPQAYQALQKWRKKSSSKALRLFLEDERTIRIESAIVDDSLIHPKLDHLVKEIKHSLSNLTSYKSKIIIFSNFRDTVRFLHSALSKAGIVSDIFVGHSSTSADKGLSSKQQLDVVKAFKEGDLNILLSTSVGEEGLDVGNCDLVVFYDSVPSVVRAVQRRGRGRKKKSKVIHLVTKGTRDEAMYWAIKRKDQQMKKFLKHDLPELLSSQEQKAASETLDKYFSVGDEKSEIDKEKSKSPQVYVDVRESTSKIPKLLKEKGAQIKPKNLLVGDYILSDRLIVERKSYKDFIDSIIDGRLFQSSTSGQSSQLERLAEQILPLLIIQLDSEMPTRQINVNSIMGALSSIILDFNIPIVYTQGDLETASLLFNLAKREQYTERTGISLPSISRKESTIREVQTYMLSVIPGINITKAKALLKDFHTINAIAEATLEEIERVEGIGKKLALRIKTILTSSNPELEL